MQGSLEPAPAACSPPPAAAAAMRACMNRISSSGVRFMCIVSLSIFKVLCDVATSGKHACSKLLLCSTAPLGAAVRACANALEGFLVLTVLLERREAGDSSGLVRLRLGTSVQTVHDSWVGTCQCQAGPLTWITLQHFVTYVQYSP